MRAAPPAESPDATEKPPAASDCGSPVDETFEQRDVHFERDVLPYLDRVYSTARWLTDSPAAAENLVWETFANAFVSLRQRRPSSNLREWLYRIVITAYMDGHQRPRGPRQDHTGQVQAGLTPLAHAQLLDRLPDRDVRAAMQSLPDGLRIAIYLADVERFSYQEIAGITGAPIQIVKARLHHGRRQLRATLAAAVSRALPGGAGSERAGEPRPSNRLV